MTPSVLSHQSSVVSRPPPPASPTAPEQPPHVASPTSHRRGKFPLPNATPVSPIYWMIENNRRREYDYERARETTILDVMKRLEDNVRKGQTPESIDPIVATWAGRWSKWITVQTVINSRTKSRRVILSAANPAIAMELRPRLAALLASLKPTGITEVMFR